MMGVERSDLRSGVRILPLWRRIVIVYELPVGRVDVLRVFSGGRDYAAIISETADPSEE
jgi:toxin ParE1/3/4